MKENILSKIKSYNFYLIIAVLLGIFIRLYGLDIQGFWFDELAISFPTISQIPGSLMNLLKQDLHPPLYPLLLHVWMKIFGTTETAIRLPSAIVGVLAIFFMYFMSKRFFNRHVAILATILISLSSAGIFYSQEARNYSFVLLFSVISTLLWLNLAKKIKESEITRKELTVYGIVCIITCYFHYFGAAFIFFQLIYLFALSLKFRQQILKVIILGLSIAAAFLPWFIYHYAFLKAINNGSFWLKGPDLSSLFMLMDFLFNKKLIILLLIPIFINLKEILKRIKDLNLSFSILSLLYLSVCPVFVIFIISFFVPVFFPRYFIVILPAVYLLTAVLISLNSSFNEHRINAYVFFISILSLVLFLFVPGNNILDNKKAFYQPYKQQWREASKYVIDNYNPKDSVIYVDRHPLIYVYYFNRFNKDIKALDVNHYNFIIEKEHLDRIKQYYNRVFFVKSFERAPEKMENTFNKSCSNYKMNEFTLVTVYECSFK